MDPERHASRDGHDGDGTSRVVFQGQCQVGQGIQGRGDVNELHEVPFSKGDALMLAPAEIEVSPVFPKRMKV